MATTLESLTDRLRTRRTLPPPDVCRALRRGAGASQAEVAEVIGVTRQAVQLWEAGIRTPRGPNLDAYLGLLRAFRRVLDQDPSESATPAVAGEEASRVVNNVEGYHPSPPT
jgi:DNA-binding transcriptional regulator YiaG